MKLLLIAFFTTTAIAEVNSSAVISTCIVEAGGADGADGADGGSPPPSSMTIQVVYQPPSGDTTTAEICTGGHGASASKQYFGGTYTASSYMDAAVKCAGRSHTVEVRWSCGYMGATLPWDANGTATCTGVGMSGGSCLCSP